MANFDTAKLFQKWKDRFAASTDQELVDAFNNEVGVTAWVSVRGGYLKYLQEEMERRAFDDAAVRCIQKHTDDTGPCGIMHIPGKRRIILEGKRLHFADE